jgi:hypothetical protein
MAPGVHRVRRQSWRLGVRSAREAFDARLRLRRALEDELPQTLQRAFDRAAPGDAPVHIPRLELRLRVPNLEALAERLAEALDQALERELRFQSPDRKVEAPLDPLEVLLAYLDSGTLAWHAAQGDPAVAASALRATLLENLTAVAQRGPPTGAVFSNWLQFYFRLLALLPSEQWPLLAAVSSPTSEKRADPAEVAAAVATLLAEDNDPETLLPQALALACRSPRAAIAALIALRLPVRHRAQRLAAAFLANSRLPPTTGAVSSFEVVTAAAGVLPVSAPAKSVGNAPQGARQAPRESPARVVPVTRHDESAITQSFALMVGNAGLVLLHPFLPRLFEACDLHWDGVRPVEPEKAAALLHWLATGRDEVHEFELGCVKVLLGLRPEAPLAVGEGLVGKREREEGEALLASVIGHWKALGNTSTEALRVAFLQRRGALREEEAGWRLQLEPESYDVLLGRLPWGLATVKLPWMTRPLYTDWPTP